MPSAVAEGETIGSPEKKRDKKFKRERGELKSKKRHRETDGKAEDEPQHKRSKSETTASLPTPPEQDAEDASAKSSRKKKDKRKQKRQSQDGAELAQIEEDAPVSIISQETDAAQDPPPQVVDEQTATDRKRRKKEKKLHQTKGETVAIEDATQDGDEPAAEPTGEVTSPPVEKRSKKHKRKHADEVPPEELHPDGDAPEPAADPAIQPSAAELDKDAVKAERKRRKREKKEKRRQEKELQREDEDAAATAEPRALETEDTQPAGTDVDAMDIDTVTSFNRPFGRLPEEPFPFFTQQVSQYLPLFPLGINDPIEGYTEQHLKPLLNHYVPTFKGVLLGYHDVKVGEAPGKGSITESSEGQEEALLESIDEYGVGFAWLTAKLDLFKPARGAWMEGVVNMQTEGHLGVVCWGTFNASIEAGRLPSKWQWVSLLGKGRSGREKTPEEARLPTPEPTDDNKDDESTQLHATGYWVDDQRRRIRGRLQFQIKNFEVGVSGDYGYLSIEGTMLEPDAEKEKAAEEVEKLRRWRLKNGASRREQKRLPDFSMTKFGLDEEQEDESQRAEVWKGSRPASEIAE